jgi:hypothetical protein
MPGDRLRGEPRAAGAGQPAGARQEPPAEGRGVKRSVIGHTGNPQWSVMNEAPDKAVSLHEKPSTIAMLKVE